MQKTVIPRPIRVLYEAYNLYGLVGLAVGIVLTVLFWAESHVVALLVLILSFPLGVITAAGFVLLRGKALPTEPQIQTQLPRRELRGAFSLYNVEWAELRSGDLEIRCPEHHTPLMFWPLRKPPDIRGFSSEGSRRLPEDNDYPYGDDRLWCPTGAEDWRFPEPMSIGEAKQRIRLNHRGERNRQTS